MCGISGIFSKSIINDHLINISKQFIDKISHRGPDHTGIYVNREQNIILNHKRLSILDLTSNGNQPYISNSERYILVFNGEIYNHNEIRKNFFSQDFKWKSTCDTETVIEFIDKFGLEHFLNIADGMFAFALWDKRDQKLSLARDAFGEKPLYFGFFKDSLYFSSELKSFEVFLKDLEIYSLAIKNFLELSYIPAPITIYKNIYKLEKGSFITVSKEDLNRLINQNNSQYFSNIKKFFFLPEKLIKEKKDQINYLDFEENIENELMKSIKSRMVSDVNTGIFLSGGIDSSLIAALASRVSYEKLKTFTISSDNKNFDEGDKAKQISQRLNTDHNEIIINPNDMMRFIEKLPDIFDEPFADSSQLPSLLLSEFASKNVKVALTGDGADEIFKGYNRYIYSYDLWLLINKIPKKIRPLIANLFYAFKPKNIFQIQKILNKFLQKKNNFELLDEKIYKIADSLINSNTLKNHYFSHLAIWQKSESIFLEDDKELLCDIDVFDKYHLTSDNYKEFINLLDINSYLSEDILVKTDRSSMFFSMEARSPYLNKSLLNLTLNTNEKYLINNRSGKFVLKKILSKYLDEKIFQGPKKGFSVPINNWLSFELKNWGEDLVNSRILKHSNYLNSQLVCKYWDEHQSGKKNYHKRIWNLLVLIDWAKKKGKSI